MKKISITNSAILYNDISELSPKDFSLMEEAKKATQNAYAPYSKFNVGCAILLENGIIVHGSNQENAAYPSGMCAERVAIWKVGNDYPNVIIKKIAITVKSENKTINTPLPPCGACRQTLSEFEINQQQPIEILFMGEIGQIVKTESLLSLLPFHFDSSYL